MNTRRRRSCQKPKYTSPQSQLVITALLISLEVIINVCWLIHDKPAVAHVYPTREENVLICLGSDNTSYLVGLIYPSILIGQLGFHTTQSFQLYMSFHLQIQNKHKYSHNFPYFLQAFAPHMPLKPVNARKGSMKLDI